MSLAAEVIHRGGFILVAVDERERVSGDVLRTEVRALEKLYPKLHITCGSDESPELRLVFRIDGGSTALAEELRRRYAVEPTVYKEADPDIVVVYVHEGIAVLEPTRLVTVKKLLKKAADLARLTNRTVRYDLKENALRLAPVSKVFDCALDEYQDVLVTELQPRRTFVSNATAGVKNGRIYVQFQVPARFDPAAGRSRVSGIEYVLSDPAPEYAKGAREDDNGYFWVFVNAGPQHEIEEIFVMAAAIAEKAGVWLIGKFRYFKRERVDEGYTPLLRSVLPVV